MFLYDFLDGVCLKKIEIVVLIFCKHVCLKKFWANFIKDFKATDAISSKYQWLQEQRSTKYLQFST